MDWYNEPPNWSAHNGTVTMQSAPQTDFFQQPRIFGPSMGTVTAIIQVICLARKEQTGIIYARFCALSASSVVLRRLSC